jgi:ABC-type transport system, ATPase component
MQQRFYELIHEEKKKGTTIFYSTHILSEISKVCDRVGLVKNGKLLKVETMEEMQKKRFTFVKISSPEREKIIEAFHLKTYQEEDGMLKFKNQFPIDQLLQILSQYHIDQLLIEEATLEEMLLEAYL